VPGLVRENQRKVYRSALAFVAQVQRVKRWVFLQLLGFLVFFTA
jgi:hypothetical protein